MILCGGSGTRLWPLSRELFPKQLLNLVDDSSLLQNTVTRCMAHPDVSETILVCNEEHRFLVAEQLRETGAAGSKIILEPEGRNTAPAVALAANIAARTDDDALLLVLPSDHVISQQGVFLDAVSEALQWAKSDNLVTFGIVPSHAETGYGYIRRGEPMADSFRVDQFVEKPDQARAAEFVQAGDYYWNSGMFVFKAGTYLKELQRQNPDMATACRNATRAIEEDPDFVRVDAEAFKASPSDSIDYAVMEGTSNAVVVPLDAGWSDIGSWDALWDISPKDQHQNSLLGDVVVSDVQNSLVRAEHRLVSVVGVDNVVVIETADAVMVASQDKAQDVKTIVDQLRQGDRDESSLHRKVFRPWGYYEDLDTGPSFKVKRIGVNPGASLSLQLHHRRAEHWVVVKGIATVTCGEKTFELQENESTYIPLETKHRLQNLSTGELEIIEVQSGEDPSEDDIVRFEDIYGRDTRK